MSENLYGQYYDEPLWESGPNKNPLTPHAWSLEFSRWAQAACWYKSAEKIEENCRVLALPVWAWRKPKVKMPKTKEGRLFPIKIMWGTPITAPFDGPTAATWSINALGNSEEGIAEIDSDGVVSGVDSFSPSIITNRDELIEKGKLAYWQIYEKIRIWTDEKIMDAVRKIYAEIPGIQISSTDIEIISTKIESGSRSPMKKVLTQICDPTDPGFTGADPLRVISTEIRRTALEVVRTSLGDTQKGWKVRRVAGEIGTENTREIKEELDRRYPADKTGIRAIEKALAFGKIAPQVSEIEKEEHFG